MGCTTLLLDVPELQFQTWRDDAEVIVGKVDGDFNSISPKKNVESNLRGKADRREDEVS